MTEWQSNRIFQLEAQLKRLESETRDYKKRIDDLESLRDQMLGMGTATRWFLKVVFAVVGTSLMVGIARFFMWLSQPIQLPRLH